MKRLCHLLSMFGTFAFFVRSIQWLRELTVQDTGNSGRQRTKVLQIPEQEHRWWVVFWFHRVSTLHIYQLCLNRLNQFDISMFIYPFWKCHICVSMSCIRRHYKVSFECEMSTLKLWITTKKLKGKWARICHREKNIWQPPQLCLKAINVLALR